MNHEQVKKFLMGVIYTPDAKPRFIGGDVESKLKFIDEKAMELLAMINEGKRVEKAQQFILVDEDTGWIEDQIKLIEAAADEDIDQMIDGIDGVQVVELYENTFTVRDFLDAIA